MQRINFENTTVTRQPYVTIDGTDYEVQEGTYSGGTDLDADTFNTLQDNIEEALSNVGGNEIAISETEPTTETTKLWINSGEIGGQVSEITNEYSTSTGIGYSANYVNNMNTYDATERVIGTFMGKTLYRKVFTGTTPNNQNFTTLLDGVDYFQIVNATFDTLGYRPYPYYIDTANGRTQLDIAKTSSTLLQYRVLSATLQNVAYTFVIEYTKA